MSNKIPSSGAHINTITPHGFKAGFFELIIFQEKRGGFNEVNYEEDLVASHLQTRKRLPPEKNRFNYF